MIYREPGFLAVMLFGSMPTPSPPLPSAICLSFAVLLCFRLSSLLTGEGEEGGRGANREKVLPSIIHPILSDPVVCVKITKPLKAHPSQNFLLAKHRA
jgi:hypothetical protein